MKWPEFRSFWCKGPAIKSLLETFSTFLLLNCLDKLSTKWHIGVSRVKNSSTSLKKLFCWMAAINGSTGPATVEYHENMTYRDAVRSGEDIPWKWESCSRAILPTCDFESTRNEGNYNFHCYLWGEKLQRLLKSGLVSVQIRLVSERKLKRMQRATYCDVQRRLFELWEAFNKKEKSLKQLLKGCANINKPVTHWTELRH